MALAYKIREAMIKQGIRDEIVSLFHFPGPRETTLDDLINIASLMEKLLTKEQCLSIMEQQGCCKTGKMESGNRAFGREHAEKTIEEKIKLYAESDVPYKVPCRLNADGTLTLFCQLEQHANKFRCHCPEMKKIKKKPVKTPLTYCGCCGGHVRHAYQLALGVKLKMIDIVSSVSNSNGENTCEFTFEIVE
jgi:hypothetical protein